MPGKATFETLQFMADASNLVWRSMAAASATPS
jgi:hypothetical protein